MIDEERYEEPVDEGLTMLRIAETIRWASLAVVGFAIILMLLSSCCSTPTGGEVKKVVRDTVWNNRIVHDSIRVEATPKITITDTNFISIMPFIASLDSLIKLNGKDVKMHVSYSVPENQLKINVDQIKIDSIPTVTTTKTEVVQLPPEPMSWWWWIIIILGGIAAVVIGAFLGRFFR